MAITDKVVAIRVPVRHRCRALDLPGGIVRLRNLVVAVITATVTIAVTNAVKSAQAERDLWAEASDSVD